MTETHSSSRSSAGTFFLLTFALSWAIWLPGTLAATGILPIVLSDTVYVILNVAGGSIPTIAGLFLFYRQGGGVAVKDVLRSGFDPRRIGRVWWIPLLLLYPLVNAAALGLGILAGGPVPELLLLQQWWLIPVFFVVGFIPISTAVREEFGWRGYALKHLQGRWNPLISSVILGVVWAAWHLPLMAFPIAASLYARIPIWVYFINAVVFSIYMTWFYNSNSGSVFTAIVFHILIDVSPQIFPYGLTDFGVYFNMVLNLLVVAVIITKQRQSWLTRNMRGPMEE